MELTNEVKELFSYIDSIIPKNGHLEYDLRDEKQMKFAKIIANSHFDTKRYPGILKNIDIQKSNQEKGIHISDIESTENDFLNFFGIPGLALDSVTQNIASNGLGTTVGGYSIMSLMLMIKDNVSGNIIVSQASNDMAGTLLPIATPPNSGSTNTDVTSYLQYSATPNGGTPINGIVKQTAYNTVADPAITAPVQITNTPAVPNAINIGLGRPWNDQGIGTQFDYAWNEPSSNSPVGKIPFVGSVTFNQNITPLAPATNFLLQIYVANQTGGGTVTLQSTNLTDVYNRFSIDATNPKKLNWNLPPGANTSDPGNPITFENVTWPSDMSAIFHCSIIVTLADGTFGSAVVESSTTADIDALDGTLQIPPVAFIWHCLGEGTEVNMYDGSKKQIEKIIAGDKVQANTKGDIATVQWTNKGIHLGKVIRITMEDDRQIIATDNHVFISEKGPIAAIDIEVGQNIVSINGTSKVTELTQIQGYKEMLYNLSTSTIEQSEKGEMGTFVANGIEVGDVNAQNAHRMALKNDINWVKNQVPAYLHVDVDSFFEDKN